MSVVSTVPAVSAVPAVPAVSAGSAVLVVCPVSLALASTNDAESVELSVVARPVVDGRSFGSPLVDGLGVFASLWSVALSGASLFDISPFNVAPFVDDDGLAGGGTAFPPAIDAISSANASPPDWLAVSRSRSSSDSDTPWGFGRKLVGSCLPSNGIAKLFGATRADSDPDIVRPPWVMSREPW